MKLSLEDTKKSRERGRAAQATLACEDIYLTEDELALFEAMEDARIPHNERRQRIVEYFWRNPHCVAF